MTSVGDAKGRPASARARSGDPAQGPLPAADVIARFGGIRPMAAKLGVPATTVQGWKDRGSIPPARRRGVIEAAARHGISLEPEVLERAPGPPPRTEEGAPTQPAPSPQPRPGRPQPLEPREPAPEGAPEGPAAPAPRRGRRLLLWGGAALGLAVLALLAGRTYVAWQGEFAPGEAEPPADAESLAAIETSPGAPPEAVTDAPQEARLAALERRLDDLIAEVETAAAVPEAEEAGADAAPSGELARLAERVRALESAAPAEKQELEARLRTVEERLAGAGGVGEGGEAPARLGDVEARLKDAVEAVRGVAAALEERKGAATIGFLLAVGQLREALRSSGPFAGDLDALRAIAGGDPEIQTVLAGLVPRAEVGIPTLAQLKRRFPRVADAAVRAAASPEGGSWLDPALSWLGGLVTVRRVGGDVPGEEVDAVVARAEAELEAGDLRAAIAEVERLTGPAAAKTAGWLADARARLEAERGLKALTARALIRLGEGGG